MDEAAQLGLGKYLRENGYTKSSVLIREHSARVFEICKKLGLEPMIWSDMYITTNTGGGYYDVADDTDCSDWEKPDPELGLVYWDYYNPDQKIYEKMIRVHQQLSKMCIRDSHSKPYVTPHAKNSGRLLASWSGNTLWALRASFEIRRLRRLSRGSADPREYSRS